MKITHAYLCYTNRGCGRWSNPLANCAETSSFRSKAWNAWKQSPLYPSAPHCCWMSVICSFDLVMSCHFAHLILHEFTDDLICINRKLRRHLSLSLSSEDFQPFQTCFRLHLTAKLMPKPSQVSSLNKALEVLAPTAYRSTFLQVFQCHDLSSARKKPSTKHTGVCALHFPGQWVLLGSMHMMLFLMPCLALPCPNNALPSCHQQPSEANSNTLF